MSDAGFLQWSKEVSTRFSGLSKPQALGLAMWSYGIAITRSSGQTTVVVFLALIGQQSVGTLRQRLREWM